MNRVVFLTLSTILICNAKGQQYFVHEPRTVMVLDSVNFQPPISAGRSYPPVFNLSFTAFEENINISLWQNVDLFSANYTRRISDSRSGKLVYEDIGNLCQYTGKVIGANNSYVAIGICNGLHGLFYNGRNIFTIHSREGHPEGGYFIRKKVNHLPGPAKPTRIHGARYIETIVVLDEAMSRKYSTSNAFDNSELIVNIANVMIKFLNLRIVLKEMVLDNGKLGLTNDQESIERYRKQRHLSGDFHDFTLMISGFSSDSYNLEGQTPLQGMCLTGYSVATVTNQHLEEMTARIVAHSIGHSIGIGHDDLQICTCNNKPCVMSMMAKELNIHWSECSLNDLEKFFRREQDTCLRNHPKTLVSSLSPICGNGKVEIGEECDCGNNCDTEPCCDSETCKFVAGAECSTGECCNSQKCMLKVRATVCRASKSDCDLDEYCDGSRPDCPSDSFIQDGSECNSGENYCFGGKCRTLELQCKQLWGDSSEVAEESCFHSNKLGNKMSYCKYDKMSKNYEACKVQDIMCGVLFCTNVITRNLIGSQWSTMKRELGVYRHGRTSMCTSTSIDLGLGIIDPGMVHDGVKCGSDRVCLSNKCVSVDRLNMTKNVCSDRGVVNNLGHCHCDIGFGKDDCSAPGPGGSLDSGPASDFQLATVSYAQEVTTANIPKTTEYVPMTTSKQEDTNEEEGGDDEENLKEEDIVVEKETQELKEEALTEIDDMLDSLLDSLDELK